MPPLNRISPYFIAAAILFLITFYHVFNVRQKNSDLERNVQIYQQELSVSKEKNKVLVKDALEKIDKKEALIKNLEKENLMKHTKLGETQTKLADMKSKLDMKNDEIKKLHQLAADHKTEISSLTSSVSKSKSVLTKLTEKADHLMLEYKKLQKQNVELQKQNDQLQVVIKKQETEKETLNGKLNTLTKDKEALGTKVDDLRKKNEIIEETIKQKIKESYAARRVMTQTQLVGMTGDPKLQDSVHVATQGEAIHSREPSNLVKNYSPDYVTKSITKNRERNAKNRSQNMTDNIGDNQNASKGVVDNANTQNIKRILVDDTESQRESYKLPDTFIAKTTAAAEQNKFVVGKEQFFKTREPSDSLDQADSQPGFQQKIIAPENGSENLGQEDISESRNLLDHQRKRRGKSFEIQRGNLETESLGERNEQDKVTDNTLAIFPRIVDDTIDRYNN